MDIKNPFDNHKPDNYQVARIEEIREMFKQCNDIVLSNAPQGRYRSLAITALEESCMWAVKAVIFE